MAGEGHRLGSGLALDCHRHEEGLEQDFSGEVKLRRHVK
jgi:hypothetical protein